MTLTELSQRTLSNAALVASVSADGGTAVIALRGEADLATLRVVVDVLARVIADTNGPVTVDLAHIEFIDTGTARALARAREFLNDRGRTLTVRAPSSLAVRVLTLLGLTDLIEPGSVTAA